MNDTPAVAVENGAEEVERPGDVEVADIDVPVTVGCHWLHEPSAFLAGHR